MSVHEIQSPSPPLEHYSSSSPFQFFSLLHQSHQLKTCCYFSHIKPKRKKPLLVTLLLLPATHPHFFFYASLCNKIKLFSALFSISTSGYTPKRIESKVSKRYLHTHVHSSIIYSSQKVEATQMATDECKDKQNVVYTSDGILFSPEKERI